MSLLWSLDITLKLALWFQVSSFLQCSLANLWTSDYILIILFTDIGFPGGWMVKKLPAMQERRCSRSYGFDPWVRKIPWRGKRQPTQVFLPTGLRGTLLGTKAPLCPHFLFVEKVSCFLGLSWIPNSRLKQLLIREVREHRNKGIANQEKKSNNIVKNSSVIKQSPSSSSGHTHNNLMWIFELFCRTKDPHTQVEDCDYPFFPQAWSPQTGWNQETDD